MSPAEREKIFLEVHIQNLTQDSLWFERMKFESVEGWDVVDANSFGGDEALFTGSSSLMLPQDMRQYIYILSPKLIALEPLAHAPGSAIPLGRLDLSWRSSYGEPGRLLTSLLSRKIPAAAPPTVAPTASAIPPYLKKGGSSSSPVPSRPTSPSLGQRSGSPFRNRPASVQSTVSQSPTLVPHPLETDLRLSLAVSQLPRDEIKVGKPFKVAFTLAASAPAPLPPSSGRRLTIVAQHLRNPVLAAPSVASGVHEAYSPRLTASGLSTPSPTSATFNLNLAHEKLVHVARHHDEPSSIQYDTDGQTPIPEGLSHLPPPFFDSPVERLSLSGVRPDGGSIVILAPMEMALDSEAADASGRTIRAVQEFEMWYLPVKKGFSPVGGLRVLVIDDKVVPAPDGVDQTELRRSVLAEKQWEVVAEVWVS
jgi:trafficking protein particle complex subunit 13